MTIGYAQAIGRSLRPTYQELLLKVLGRSPEETFFQEGFLWRVPSHPSHPLSCCQLDEQGAVIGHVAAIGGFVAADLAALFASVNDHESFFGIGFRSDGAKGAPTGIGTVARQDIHVKRPQAIGAMVPRGIPQRGNLLAAMGADEGFILLGKSLLLQLHLLSSLAQVVVQRLLVLLAKGNVQRLIHKGIQAKGAVRLFLVLNIPVIVNVGIDCQQQPTTQEADYV